jgi:hypothetical protein
MTDIRSLLDTIRRTPGCILSARTGLPSLPHSLSLPADLREFFEACGGALLFSERVCPGPVRIVGPDEVQRIDITMTGAQFASGPFQWWFAIADVVDGNYIAIDLNPQHQGLCYDAFHETYAWPGYVNVVASSFSDFLRRLLNHKEDSAYWLQKDFKPLGEAFELYGFNAIG